jgi:hypothetical protein
MEAEPSRRAPRLSISTTLFRKSKSTDKLLTYTFNYLLHKFRLQDRQAPDRLIRGEGQSPAWGRKNFVAAATDTDKTASAPSRADDKRLWGRSLSRPFVVLLIVVGAIVAYFYFSGVYTNRFRLTIEVNTPDGLKTGSSVIETRFWESGSWGPIEARGVRADARGEAVYVDLGGGRHVIAILGWGAKGEDQDKVYGLTCAARAPGRRVDWKDEYKLKGKGELPPEYVPAFVIFTNLTDPKTARIVPRGKFEEVFGPGVHFARATIETTGDAVTTQLSARLPWLPHPRYLSGEFACGPAEPHCLHGGNLKR